MLKEKKREKKFLFVSISMEIGFHIEREKKEKRISHLYQNPWRSTSMLNEKKREHFFSFLLVQHGNGILTFIF